MNTLETERQEKPRTHLAIWIVLLLTPHIVRASTWVDPTFEEMLEGSDLIAACEVVESGHFQAKVKALDVLKGKAPKAPFLVAGFNNEHWPKQAVETESFQKGQRFLLFLWRGELRTEDGKKKPAWFTRTPSSCDFPIRDGKVHGNWFRPSYPHSDPGVDAKLVLTLVRAAVPKATAKAVKAARDAIAKELTVRLIGKIRPPKPNDEDEASDEDKDEDDELSSEDKELQENVYKAHWLLCAQAAYGDQRPSEAVIAAAKSESLLVAVCAARALRTAVPVTTVLTQLKTLLKTPDSFVQAEAAKTLLLGATQKPPRFRTKGAVEALVAAVPASYSDDGGPRRLMDPIQNSYISGREMMIAALTKLEAKSAQAVLQKLIAPEGLSESVFLALAKFFLKYPSDAARTKFLELYAEAPEEALPIFHEYMLKENSDESIQAIRKQLEAGKVDAYELADEIEEMEPTTARRLTLAFLDGLDDFEIGETLMPLCVRFASSEIADFLKTYE
ncbi:MAG: hypothetical protein AAF517_23265, partial [Planctomycetota bacterium]